MNGSTSALRHLYNTSAVLAGVMLVGVFVVMIAETVLRKFFGSYVPGASQWISWCCAGSAFLAMPYAFLRGDFVRVDLITSSLGTRAQHRLELLALALMLAFCAFATYACGRYVWGAYTSDEITQGMIEVPLWWPQLTLLLGMALLALAVAERIWQVLQRGPAAPSPLTTEVT
jgi:TRAP-type C4-dicarboxylate transport system permease small subunit